MEQILHSVLQLHVEEVQTRATERELVAQAETLEVVEQEMQRHSLRAVVVADQVQPVQGEMVVQVLSLTSLVLQRNMAVVEHRWVTAHHRSMEQRPAVAEFLQLTTQM
jgi:hypothetical protein